MMKCLLDMDGVLVNFVRGACARVQKANPYYDSYGNVKESSLGVFNTWKLLDVPVDIFLGAMEYDDWANLSPLEDAFDILQMVEDTFGKKNVCILSNPMAHPSMSGWIMEAKHQWIKEHIPFYWNRFLFGPQKEFCANPNHVLIDDYDKNVNDFIIHNGKACLVPRPWNSAHSLNTLDTVRTFLDEL